MEPLRISWSSLRTHEECKQRGHLMRTGKRASLEDQRNYFPGTVVDRIMRDWLESDPYNTPGLMKDMVLAYIAREEAAILDGGGKMKWRDDKDKDEVIKTCLEAVEKLEPLLNEHVLPFDFQAAERFKTPFMLPHPDGTMEAVILNGETDLIVRNDAGEFAVLDLKITRDNGYWRKTAAQLTFYDLVIDILYGQPTSKAGLLQPLATPMWKPIGIDDDARRQLLQRIIGMARDIWSENFEPRADTSLCGYCAVKHACVKFKPVVVNGRRTVKLLG